MFFICSTVVIGSAIFFLWAMQPENFRREKALIQGFLFESFQEDSYNAASLILVDRENDSGFISKREREQRVPASLAKLFVVEYAASMVDLDCLVTPSPEAIALTKPGSSVAGIETREYAFRDLLAAMLVPSGNDAAYAVADYCGGLLAPEAAPGQERVEVFMENLNRRLKEAGYTDTVLYDPSGFDTDALTSALDLKSVTDVLLEYQWFRDMVSQSYYTTELPDGGIYTWKNTNAFLDPESEYYNGNVEGIKTGSLFDDFNLVVLYRQYGKEFLICSLGSESDSSRYDDVSNIIRTIDESSFLAE